jgi:hypothetical protein
MLVFPPFFFDVIDLFNFEKLSAVYLDLIYDELFIWQDLNLTPEYFRGFTFVMVYK